MGDLHLISLNINVHFIEEFINDLYKKPELAFTALLASLVVFRPCASVLLQPGARSISSVHEAGRDRTGVPWSNSIPAMCSFLSAAVTKVEG